MPPIRAWGLTRQNYNAMLNAMNFWTTLRNEMAQDIAYSGNVLIIDHCIAELGNVLALLDAHLSAEGK
jgi:hypothetical protein